MKEDETLDIGLPMTHPTGHGTPNDISQAMGSQISVHSYAFEVLSSLT